MSLDFDLNMKLFHKCIVTPRRATWDIPAVRPPSRQVARPPPDRRLAGIPALWPTALGPSWRDVLVLFVKQIPRNND